MVLGNCVRLKCDEPKCSEVVHICLPNPAPTNMQIFVGIYFGAVTEQGWMIPDLDREEHQHLCYKHGIGAKLDKKVL